LGPGLAGAGGGRPPSSGTLIIWDVGATVGTDAGVVGGWVGCCLDTVLPNVLKAGLLAVVNLAAVVGFSKATVVRGFSVSTWILAGLSVC